MGDFLFQTSKIVAWKQRSIHGVLFHVLIVFLATLFVFLPYANSPWIWGILIVNAVIHVFIDHGKIQYEKKHKPKNIVIPFFLDQIIHIAVIAGLVLLLPSNIEPAYFTSAWWFGFYEQTNLLLYIAGFLFFSYTFDIIYFIHRLNKDRSHKYERSYYSMIVRMFIFACIFILLWGIGRFYLGIF